MKNIIQLKHSDIPGIRKEVLEDQGGICQICKKLPVRPVLDHSHKKKNKGSGLVRGVLCSNCNVLLAKVENNATRYGVSNQDLPGVLSQMAHYVCMAHYPYMHPTEEPKDRTLMKSSYNEIAKLAKAMPGYNNGKFTAGLKMLFKKYNITPKFYGDNDGTTS